MIKFIEKEEVKQLTFGDVEDDQFFESADGYLYQKGNNVWANAIAKPNGKPHSSRDRFDKNNPIRRIINIERIEF